MCKHANTTSPLDFNTALVTCTVDQSNKYLWHSNGKNYFIVWRLKFGNFLTNLWNGFKILALDLINAKFHGYELDEKLKVKVRNDRLVKDQKQSPEVFYKKKFS